MDLALGVPVVNYIRSGFGITLRIRPRIELCEAKSIFWATLAEIDIHSTTQWKRRQGRLPSDIIRKNRTAVSHNHLPIHREVERYTSDRPERNKLTIVQSLGVG